MTENKAFESIMRGLTESLEYAKGDSSKARKMSVTVAELPQYHDAGNSPCDDKIPGVP
jgi:putative transcriptional regulator